jgi:hypothetical protein
MAAVSSIVAVAAVVVSAGVSYSSQRATKKAGKRAQEKEEEAKKVAQAEQVAQQREKTRAQLRDERVRRAQILQSSANTGVTGSSGESGSTGALNTALGANLASMTRQGNSANIITNLQQGAANALRDGANKVAQYQTIGAVANAATSAYGAFASPTPAATTTTYNTPGGQSPSTVANPYALKF